MNYLYAFGAGVAATVSVQIAWKRYGAAKWAALMAKVRLAIAGQLR
jgi:hypothetical protein